jgi:hypothetical protein
MSRVTELLNQIAELIQQYNSEKWHKINLDPGLTSEQIQLLCKGKPFLLPTEILELYQWRNGSGLGSIQSNRIVVTLFRTIAIATLDTSTKNQLFQFVRECR